MIELETFADYINGVYSVLSLILAPKFFKKGYDHCGRYNHFK